MAEQPDPGPTKLTAACDTPVSGTQSAAECMYKKLMAHIADFETSLMPDQEVGASIVSILSPKVLI